MSIESTAVLFDGPGTEPYFGTVTVREPRGSEVLLRMTAAGVCHSDLHVVNGDWPYDHRLALGHEGTGVVAQVGPDVTDLEVGDHVLLSWFATCGGCPACIEGETWLCSRSSTVVNGAPDGQTPLTAPDGRDVRPYLGVGTFSEYVLAGRRSVVKIPADFPADVAALIGCSILTGYGAVVNTAAMPIGQRALVAGCGGVGQAILMSLGLVHAETIIAVDVSETQLDLALDLGATHALDANDPDLVERVQEISGGGVDYAFDAIGRPGTAALLPSLVRQGGASVLVGMPRRDATAPIPTWPIVAMNQRILGCNYGSSNIQIDFPRIVGLYRSGRLDLDRLVGRRIPHSRTVQALFDLPTHTGGRTVVDFSA
ncbi:alcohol dehydrogenase catalytic domain-containing protein [Microbacterium fluvii]|uniref:Alcohol dehydrogenase catalytic domain-containing protein n=1 Tax=Microbacterium fluvii TaxID=415215 RepID=A0ABW2HD24_9MICO|nr:alcohol dehydrogenase catalytic domain-containing protein [Microbacterium fluvii]MCU4672792.1 alcohol dehydrogenase catalytic domain-containing protein [Microbacterium fluvii]